LSAWAKVADFEASGLPGRWWIETDREVFRWACEVNGERTSGACVATEDKAWLSMALAAGLMMRAIDDAKAGA
jgi:hypothetical protein